HINEFIKLPSVEFYEIEGKRVSLKTTDSEKLLREIVMTKIHFEDLYISEQDLEGYFAKNSQVVANLCEVIFIKQYYFISICNLTILFNSYLLITLILYTI